MLQLSQPGIVGKTLEKQFLWKGGGCRKLAQDNLGKKIGSKPSNPEFFREVACCESNLQGAVAKRWLSAGAVHLYLQFLGK